MLVQLFINYNFPRGWYLTNSRCARQTGPHPGDMSTRRVAVTLRLGRTCEDLRSCRMPPM